MTLPKLGMGDASRLRQRLRVTDGLHRVALISSSLLGTQAITSVLGLVFWAVAARATSVSAVGVAAAAVSLMLLLGSVGMLGLGTLLISEVPNRPPEQRRSLLLISLAAAAAASLVIGALAVLPIEMFGGSTLRSIASPFNASDFAVGVSLTGLTMVLDQAVLVIGVGQLQLERNTVASASKIVVLVLLTVAGLDSGMDIFLAWTVGNIVSLMFIAMRMRERDQPQRARLRLGLSAFRRVVRSAASHHALNLMLQAPLPLLSLVVAVRLSAVDNAYFSTARSVAGFVFVVPFSITIALFAAAEGRELELARKMRFTVPLGLALSIAANVVLFPIGRDVLNVFGHSYALGALSTLRLLALAGIPFVIKDHFVALRRVQGRTGQAAALALLGTVFELAAAVVGAAVGGSVGLCAFWLGALALEAAGVGVPLARASSAAHAALSLEEAQREDAARPDSPELSRVQPTS